MKRYGSVTKLRPESVTKYVKLHADTWPGVLARIKSCNIHNYSIFHKNMPDGSHYLFSYFEYAGNDFESDMKQMAADPVVQKWWGECKPCLSPVEDLPDGETWAAMQEVFYQE